LADVKLSKEDAERAGEKTGTMMQKYYSVPRQPGESEFVGK
jgi:hypothetical protein